jgi:hypothetical protein
VLLAVVGWQPQPKRNNLSVHKAQTTSVETPEVAKSTVLQTRSLGN